MITNDQATDTTLPQSSNGISTTTLVVGVVVPIVSLLIAFVILVWVAFRRGWVSRTRCDAIHNQNHGDMTGRRSRELPAFGCTVGPAEMHNKSQRYQAGSAEIYQLAGDEIRSP
jgi:hypothetical protein